MNRPPYTNWFYTRAGEPVGPISFEELKAKFNSPFLRPQSDMVWAEGMEGWTRATEIEGLCEEVGPTMPGQAGSAHSAQDGDWYYLQGEQQKGPVPLAKLREMMADSSLKPPLNMVWKPGMEQWKPVYLVADLCGAVVSPVLRSDSGTLKTEISKEVVPVKTDPKPANGKPQGFEGPISVAGLAAQEELEGTSMTLEEKLRMVAAARTAEKQALSFSNGTEGKGATMVESPQKEVEEEPSDNALAVGFEGEWLAAEAARARIEEEAKALAAAKARADEENRAAEAARWRAEEEERAIAAARARAEEEARIHEMEAAKVRSLADEKALAMKAQAEEEARAMEAEEARVAIVAKARQEEEARAAAARARVEEEERAAAAAKARMEEEARAAEAARIRAEEENRALEAARARAEEESRIRAEQEARLKAEMEAHAAAEARAAAAAQARAEEEARARAADEARIQYEAEARAAEQARLAALAQAQAEEETKARMIEQARLRAEEEARLIEAARMEAAARAKAEEEAAAAARARADEENRAREAEEARAAAARARAEEERRLRQEHEARIAAERVRAEEEARNIENARLAAERAREEEVLRLRQAEEARIAAERAHMEEAARIMEQARLAAERARAEEEAAAHARTRAEEEARLRREQEARIAAERAQVEEQARLAAERARAEQEAAAALAKAQEEAALRQAEQSRIAAEHAHAQEQARVLEHARMEARARAEQETALLARARADEEARLEQEEEARRNDERAQAAEAARIMEQARLAAAEPRNPSSEALPAFLAGGAAKVPSVLQFDTPPIESLPQSAPAPAPQAESVSPAPEPAGAAEPVKPRIPTGDSAKHIWYYTCEGEREGPVTFEDLRNFASGGGLDPRLDMVWKKGTPDWKPAGQIEGLFEKRSGNEETRESLAPPSDPYVAPSLKHGGEELNKDSGWPGARRRSYILVTLLLPVGWAVGMAFAAPLLIQQFGPELMGTLLPISQLVPCIFVIYIALNRLTNLGMSRWWFLANFLPLVNLWVGYRSFACPPGYAYHKKMDGAGIALAIVYWLMVLASLLLVAAMFAIIFGAVGSPEFKQQILDMIREASRQGAKH